MNNRIDKERIHLMSPCATVCAAAEIAPVVEESVLRAAIEKVLRAHAILCCRVILDADGEARFAPNGAPGVGKSGLMRRVAGRQRAAGHAVSLFSCSSDPDSLDGIVDETLDVAMLDATSPHAYDPLLPGARDILLNLGEFLDCDALSGDVSRLEELRARTAECFRNACAYLTAAEAIRSAVRPAGDFRKPENDLKALLPDEARPGGRERRFFLGAHTCMGYVSFAGDFAREITVRVACPFGGSPDALLRALGAEARARGLDVVYFLDPLSPETYAQLYLPQLPLFITGERVPAARVYDGLFADSTSTPPEYEAVLNRAYGCLRAAKALHDETESRYIPRMDFSALVDVESRVYREMDALAREVDGGAGL